jgi:glycosyltransferase involved in cell wall biosynthesis
MTEPLRIAIVAPVATSVPPPLSGSIETMTALLANGLVARGHDVTLFATGSSSTQARLHATFATGYREDAALWPWELCELFNLSAAVERAASFDVIHYQAEYTPLGSAFRRLTRTPLLQTLHHAPGPEEIALWSAYSDAPFVAVSDEQARSWRASPSWPRSTTAWTRRRLRSARRRTTTCCSSAGSPRARARWRRSEVARRAGMRCLLSRPRRTTTTARWWHRSWTVPACSMWARSGPRPKPRSLAARALLYPVQAAEPFGLVITEAMACGTPVAALDRGAVPELVAHGVTGGVFSSLDALVSGLPAVIALSRSRVRTKALERFGVDRMVGAYEAVYQTLARGADA